MWSRGRWLFALVLACPACVADDTGAVGLCTETMVAGQAAECVCDGDRPGVQTCQDDGTLSPCSCAPPGSDDRDPPSRPPSGDGGAPHGDGDDDSMRGDGDGDSMHGDGDGDSMHGDGDGDVMVGDGDWMADREVPDDGGQLAFCDAPGQCNEGLNCYVFGNYCSAECFRDEDCADLGDAWGCFGAFPDGPQGESFPGICRRACRDESDDSCPDHMICVPTGGGGFPGGEPGFRCIYTEDAVPMGSQDVPPFGACTAHRDCMPGLSCAGGFPRGFPGVRPSGGYCTQECTDSESCTEQPSSGTVVPECLGFPGTGVGSCNLDCTLDQNGCPDGMECIVFALGGGETFGICDYF